MSSSPEQDLAHGFFLGFARVKLEYLRFDSGVRDYDKSNIDRLRMIFRDEGCQRENRKHYIPAVVPSAILGSWRPKGEELSDLTPPAGETILCLHGKHRVLAAREFLSHRDQWWNLQIYNEGTT